MSMFDADGFRMRPTTLREFVERIAEHGVDGDPENYKHDARVLLGNLDRAAESERIRRQRGAWVVRDVE